jgi:hypothetical protein
VSLPSAIRWVPSAMCYRPPSPLNRARSRGSAVTVTRSDSPGSSATRLKPSSRSVAQLVVLEVSRRYLGMPGAASAPGPG